MTLEWAGKVAERKKMRRRGINNEVSSAPPVSFYCFCNKNKADNRKQKKKKARDKRENRRIRRAEEDGVSLGQE